MSGKLGFSSQKQSQSSQSRPYFTNTPFSSYTGTSLTLDPSIRTLQEEALGRSRGLLGNLSQGTSDYLTRSMDIRNRLMGGESQFRQARVNPVLQAGATRRGQLQEQIGARQIGGSSFAEQSLSNLDFDTARQVGDASALADAESLSAVTGLDKDMLNAIIGRVQVEANINGWTTDVAQQRLQQELDSFGLGTSQTGTSKGRTIGGELIFGEKPPVPGGGFCYVAEALYGIGTEKTETIRLYVGKHLYDESWFSKFLKLYKKYGKSWAILVSKNKMVHSFAKLIWDKMYSKAEKENGRISQ